MKTRNDGPARGFYSFIKTKLGTESAENESRAMKAVLWAEEYHRPNLEKSDFEELWKKYQEYEEGA